MEIDVEQEAVDLADKIILAWSGYQRAESPIDLGEARQHGDQIASRVEVILQAEHPDADISVRVDGHGRLIAAMTPA